MDDEKTMPDGAPAPALPVRHAALRRRVGEAPPTVIEKRDMLAERIAARRAEIAQARALGEPELLDAEGQPLSVREARELKRKRRQSFERALAARLQNPETGEDLLADSIALGVLLGDPQSQKIAAEYLYDKSDAKEIDEPDDDKPRKPNLIVFGDRKIEF